MAKLPPFDGQALRFPSKGQSFPVQWDETLALFNGAEKAGVLDAPFRMIDPPPVHAATAGIASGTERKFEDLNPLRIRVIAEQLWLLGYLERKPRRNFSPRNQARNRFQQAVASFQQEAGLVVDGWVGDETWRALNALVGFESVTGIDRWQEADGTYRRAFLRAIQLRLFSYGLARHQPGPGFVAVPPANLARACEVLWALGLMSVFPSGSPPAGWMSLLFDHDGLVRAAAQFDDTFASQRIAGAEHRDVRETLRRFLVNLAKIELWLLGSEARIDGADDYPVAGLARFAHQTGR